jgi:2-polyprenyl-6-methoxyphenol hydroxylase-like FAD-dependent oxidoreductase
MPPHRGQGGCLVVHDGVVLAQRLEAVGDLANLSALLEALKRRERDERRYVERVQDNCRLFCCAQQGWPRRLLALRPLFFRAALRLRTRDQRGLVMV